MLKLKDQKVVSICVIAYNECNALPRLLDNIRGQDYPFEFIEIVLVDGMSEDNTREIMEAFAEQEKSFKRICVCNNPKRKQAAGWNVAIRNAKGDLIIRIDAHAVIPTNFVSANVACIESGEAISGGPRPNIAEENTPWQNVLLEAESSMFGSSIANYRREGEKQYVKSMFHACYAREVFEKAGLFDEQLGRTEDNEIHYRIRQCGYRLCFHPSIKSYQYVRSSLHKMMKQKYGNGYWVALTLKACPKCLSIFHFVPLCFILAIIGTTIIGSLGYWFFPAFLWAGYWTAAIIMSFFTVKGEKKEKFQIILPILFFLLHISYGVGSLAGMVKLPFWRYIKHKEMMENEDGL